MTTDSPWTVGSVTTRTSIGLPLTVRPSRPSWGSRRSEMSSSHMILMRETTPGTIRAGDAGDLLQDAVDAQPDAHLAWLRFEMDVGCALRHRLGEQGVDELDRRRLGGRLREVEDLDRLRRVLFDDLADGAVQAGHLTDDREDVLAGGDRRPHVHPGLDLHVVDGHDVGRIGHRHHQRPLASPAPTGTSSHRRATSAGSRLTAAMSSRCCERSRNSSPRRSATARPRCSLGDDALIHEQLVGV